MKIACSGMLDDDIRCDDGASRHETGFREGDRVMRLGTIYIASKSGNEPRYCIRWDGDHPKRKEEWIESSKVHPAPCSSD